MAGFKSSLKLAAVALAALMVMQEAVMVAGWNWLYQNYQLNTGTWLAEGKYILIMQNDCNLVLYYGQQPNPQGKGAIWASNTAGKGTGCAFLLQNNGNAVVYTSSGTIVFQTGTTTTTKTPKTLILQCDGNVVVYDAYTPVWATNTESPNLSQTAVNKPTLNTKHPVNHN